MATLGEILLNRHAQTVVDRLSKGEPVKVVAASLAGDLVTEHLARVLGVTAQEMPHEAPERPAKAAPKTVTVKAVKDEDVIDAEYRVVR